MALELVVGLATDFGLTPLATEQLVLRFTPSGPGIQGTYGTRLLLTDPIETTTAASNGYFTVFLMSTDDITPDVWYTVSAIWLDLTGKFIRQDDLPWKLRVPAGGGNIGALLTVPPTGTEVWVGETNNLAYRFWYQPSTATLWSNP